MAVIIQYDSIDPSQIPATARAVAGYVGGHWPDYSRLVQMFPAARHKSIAVSASEDADILDIENGDAQPADAPAWFERQKARGLTKPGFYADASTMPSVISALAEAHIPRSAYVLWEAWLGPATLPEGVQARQYTFTAFGRNLDASVCSPTFWDSPPRTHPVHNPVDYTRFDHGRFVLFGRVIDELVTVKTYDRLRATQTPRLHPNRARLAVLRLRLKWLAGRVYHVAHQQPTPAGKPSWAFDHRGWRYQQLIHRSQGQRFN